MNTNIQARPQVQTQKQEQEVKRTYKDSVFVTIFHEKAKLIELYNALFDTNYDESVRKRTSLIVTMSIGALSS